MSKIKLNETVKMDLPKLVESRLLVQANSGGGKSWAIRRITEQAFEHVQIILIDPEGEYGNMRGEYDFVYIGKDGDAPAETRSAALLAHRLLETKASAIVDIYELNMRERQQFVKVFLNAMVNAPKDLWHDCLVILDEAHKFAPEKEQSEALEAVADMASRGRKRGFCLIPATQRPAKLNKDVAAECNNKIIGRASLDIDRKRSSEELGFTSKEEILSLRNLEPGEFYAFGPAISRDVVKVTIGDVKVKPAKRGQTRATPPAPTEKVRKILAQFKDLPAEAKLEAETVKTLTDKVRALEGQARAHKCPEDADPAKVQAEAERLLKKAKEEIERAFDDEMRRFKKKVAGLRKGVGEVTKISSELLTFLENLDNEPTKAIPMPYVSMPKVPVSKPVHVPAPRVISPTNSDSESGLTNPEQRIVDAIAWMNSIGVQEPPKTAIAFLAGYTAGSGGFNNPCGSLRSKGLIDYRPGGTVILTDEGRAYANAPDTPLDTNELHARILARLPNPEQRILKPLLDHPERQMQDEELALVAGYTHGSGGYNNPKGRLRTLGLIEYLPGKIVKATDILFL